jgi:hypothetical protein
MIITEVVRRLTRQSLSYWNYWKGLRTMFREELIDKYPRSWGKSNFEWKEVAPIERKKRKFLMEPKNFGCPKNSSEFLGQCAAMPCLEGVTPTGSQSGR